MRCSRACSASSLRYEGPAGCCFFDLMIRMHLFSSATQSTTSETFYAKPFSLAYMLDLNRLKALHAVHVYGSGGAAADALMVTPSAVSQQIAKLERETVARLMERNGRAVRL